MASSHLRGNVLTLLLFNRYRRKKVTDNNTVHLQYECCQTTASTNNQEKRLKPEPEQANQGRDACRMARFPCNRVLQVALRDGQFHCLLNHSMDHLRYKDIRIPDLWQTFIKENVKIGPTNVSVPCLIQLVLLNKLVKIWREILKETKGGKGIAFTQKAVRYAWLNEVSQLWRCADDPIDSAREWCRTYSPEEGIEIIEMAPVCHARAFSFIVKDFMEAWACHTNSFLVDSTCEYSNHPRLHFQC